MRKIFLSCIVLMLAVAMQSCIVEHGQNENYTDGKGRIIADDVTEVVRDYLEFMDMAYVLDTYRRMTPEQMISFENQYGDFYTIKQIGGKWLLKFREKNYYMEDNGLELFTEGSEYTVARYRNREHEGRDEYDSCYISCIDGGRLELEFRKVVTNCYNQEGYRAGSGWIEIGEVRSAVGMLVPDYVLSGGGNYTAFGTHPFSSVVVVDWGSKGETAPYSDNLFTKGEISILTSVEGEEEKDETEVNIRGPHWTEQDVIYNGEKE